ncbi:MAG: hypothetical protein CUN55_00110 [Phototrophicales bacterium]|nr:MAG: hypothetical protein CUN55_00110 [Phototrophicales bacterium]
MIEQSRKELLDRAIDSNPNAAINYVLRGELWLLNEEYHAAIADFEKAIMLAEQEVELCDWVYLPQAILDRARQGLKMAKAFI